MSDFSSQNKNKIKLLRSACKNKLYCDVLHAVFLSRAFIKQIKKAPFKKCVFIKKERRINRALKGLVFMLLCVTVISSIMPLLIDNQNKILRQYFEIVSHVYQVFFIIVAAMVYSFDYRKKISGITKSGQFLLDFFLKPKKADDAYVSLCELYSQTWLPRHGVKKATAIVIFHGFKIIVHEYAAPLKKIYDVFIQRIGRPS